MATNWRVLLAHIRQQSHEPGPRHCQSHGMLADRRATALAATYNLPVAVDQLLQQFNIFVIDEHWARTHAIHPNRVLLLRLDLWLRPLPRLGVFRIKSRREGHSGAVFRSWG